ncbi:MAG: COX15/CtaA family protein [Pseudomonadota bacterium]
MSPSPLFYRLAIAATLLAVCVVVLGAYVRLSHAGLGCPDWPGCYGQLLVPSEEAAAEANAAYPERPLDVPKAWKEMAHRYLAGGLGFIILAIAILAWRNRDRPGQALGAPIFLLLLVIGQAALGMWTVTLLLQPTVVLAHLIGGLATLSLCFWLALRHAGATATTSPLPRAKPWVLLGLAILIGQISLGGWTSTNYAALACPDFPTCHGQWLPEYADFDEGFVLWRELGIDYEGGRLSGEARVAIHFAHRVGAVVAFLYIGALSFAILLTAPTAGLRWIAGGNLVLLGAQVMLGIGNIVLGLPLAVAVAHNGVAALLLLSFVAYIHALWPMRASTPKLAPDYADNDFLPEPNEGMQ